MEVYCHPVSLIVGVCVGCWYLGSGKNLSPDLEIYPGFHSLPMWLSYL